MPKPDPCNLQVPFRDTLYITISVPLSQSKVETNIQSMTPVDHLQQLLATRLPPADFTWLQGKAQSLAMGMGDPELFMAFSQALRHSGKAPLAATAEEQAMAESLVAGWDLRDWTLDITARAWLMASLPDLPGAPQRLLSIHQTADLGEHLALVKALFLAPRCREAMHIAREGLRSNMKTVFIGITSHNPYPALYFDENAFNQMVVKCLFVDVPLREITGLDARANPTLRQILVDLALERWAADRPVSPEMWRCVGPFADAAGLAAMERALRHGLPFEARGAALGLMSDPSGQGAALLKTHAPDLANAVVTGRLTWNNHHHD